MVASWGLVDGHPSTGQPGQVDMDTILILTRELVYVVSYVSCCLLLAAALAAVVCFLLGLLLLAT